jgi:hypothetical protein
MYQELTEKQKQEYCKYVDEDVRIKAFLDYIKCFHPVVKRHIIEKIKEM